MPLTAAPLGVLSGLQRAVGQHEADYAPILQVQVNAAGEEKSRHVLVGGVAAPGPDAVALPAQILQRGAQHVCGLVVIQGGLPVTTSTLERDSATGRTMLRV